ncbi:hypothetical protein [Paracoccus aminovorans]|uniref:hypothetical protein n=1 Tax=Paracoccus aminovorans TaxID=34004 RepID=UPI002B25D388|nr:hypothetical protein [Paracoccus aminovorans]
MPLSFRPGRALMALLLVLPSAAAAQQDPMQLCVNSCLFHHGPATNPAYEACVARQCVEAPAPPRAAQPAKPQAQGWTTGTADGGKTHLARMRSGRLELLYMCQRGSQGLVAVRGMAGSTGSMRIGIDGRRIPQPFAAKDGLRATPAPSGSALLGGLLTGGRVELADDRGQGVLPLAGSGQAIRAALAACGLRP